jgi:tryptophanyl-tRNA synthetase
MNEATRQCEKKRVLSGMRPTGRLHLGNYMGALHNWVRLQSEYDCYFLVVDWHALTTDYADTSQVSRNTMEVALDWLAAGLDPEQCVLFVQSQVRQHAELHLLLSMITPLGWLERVPTYKEQQLQIGDVEKGGKDLTTYGFLGYPLLMATDILLYQADFVPVGQDQVVHVEFTREVARRFQAFYAGPDSRPILIEPQVLLAPSPKLPGTDGRKMSKSYGNAILLTDPEPEVRQKLKTMVTDPARIRRSDPGDPDKCPVGDLHRIFSGAETLEKVYAGCRSAGIGCIECKSWLADRVVAHLEPIQQKRREYESRPATVVEILRDGSDFAAHCAEETMEQVREAMRLIRLDSSAPRPPQSVEALS